MSVRHGTVIARRYRVIDRIAVGGSGTVYRVEVLGAAPLGRPQVRALKLMNKEHAEGVAERERFVREAQIMQQLEHAHVVKIYDYGHAQDGRPYLVLPLLEGRTLEQRLSQEGALSWNEVGRISLQILSALERAHTHDIVHRDIKPANLYLVPSALGDNVQMLDFGLAKALDDPERGDVTKVGAILGTPRYMSPEQVRCEPVGHASDIYALGLVMAEMLMGRPLVGDREEIVMYAAHGSDEEHRLPIEVLRSPFAAVVRRAVAKQLSVRYQRASQMLADVSAVVAESGLSNPRLAAADMEVTQMVDPTTGLRPGPTETSEKLRRAFNAMAAKRAAPDEPPPTWRRLRPESSELYLDESDIEEIDDDVTMDPIEPAPDSQPLLLTRRSRPPADPDEITTFYQVDQDDD